MCGLWCTFGGDAESPRAEPVGARFASVRTLPSITSVANWFRGSPAIRVVCRIVRPSGGLRSTVTHGYHRMCTGAYVRTVPLNSDRMSRRLAKAGLVALRGP
jgi:hypothetical protein